MKYRIIVNDKYEISLDSFMKWSGLSRYVVDALAMQNVFQQMRDGEIVKFVRAVIYETTLKWELCTNSHQK